MADVATHKKLVNFFRFSRGQASGMFSDTPISQQPANTYRNAWGVSNQSTEEKGGGLYNMAGMKECAALQGADIRGQHFLEERDHVVVFLDRSGTSEIGYWSTETCKYTKVIDDGDITGCKLGFGTKEWIPIVSKNMLNGTCNEIHLYWSNGGTYKTLNLDRPCVPIDCDEINLFNCKCVSAPRAVTTKKGGYDLEAGAYQYFAQLEDEDHNTTNWFSISNPIYVGSKNNRAGDISEQAVNVTVEHLDPNYPYVNIGCIKTIGGGKTALAIAKLSYSPNGVAFYHRSKSQYLYDLTIEEVLVKNPGYIRGPDLFQHDRVLYLFNTIEPRELDMQARIIESVKVKGKTGRVRMRDAHLFSGMQRDAVYSFVVWYNHCDNRKTRGFHIPCFGIMPTSGSKCLECTDDNFGNAAPATAINGKPYDNPITKGNDVYTPFTPTTLDNLNDGDFDVPDDNQFIPPADSGEGNTCGCWAFEQAIGANGGLLEPIDKFEAYYNIFKDLCESGCAGPGAEIAPDGVITPRTDDGAPAAADDDTGADTRFKTLDDINLTNGEKPSTTDINNSVSQGDSGNNSDTTKGVHPGSSDAGATSSRAPITMSDCKPTIIYTDSTCCTIKEIIPCIDDEWDPIVYLSCETYPDEKRCCAPGKTYGTLAGERIRYFKMPSIAQQPHFISYHDGVPTAEHRDNHEYNNSFARFLWPEFSGIPLPEPEELDIPLCPINPFTIGWEMRDPVNDTVLASGVLFPTFEGETLGETMLFPTHGTSSRERLDRWINNNGSHATQITPTIPGYVFHSPDTAFDRPSLQADYMRNCLDLTGRGWRHKLYAEGADPDSSFVGKKNRKGATASMNLNKWERPDGNDNVRCVVAASYVPANSILDKADEFTKSLNNQNRESCVYIETDGARIKMDDTSFDRDIETHAKALTGAAQYVSLNRYIPNAYGGVTDNVYFPLWQGSSSDIGEDGKATVFVRAGDSFINYWSIKRTSYPSNHVAPHPRGIMPNFEFGGGITLPWPFKSILRKLFGTIGADCGCGTIPQGGNGLRDPRASNADNGSGTTDRWFPQVQTQLVSFPVESRVNLGFQGSGDDPAASTYRDLNGQIFDSTFDGGGDGAYERSWMDRVFATMNENARWKYILRTLLNFAFVFGIGISLIIKGLTILTHALTGTQVGFVITVMSIVAVGMGILLMLVGFIWIIAWSNTDLDNRMIDNILKITDCYPDKRPKTGANSDGDAEMKDSRVQGFENNHYEYNYDFSLVNMIEPVLGLPAGFDPCHCPNDISYPIWHSNPQNPQSQRDAYRNFKTNGYFDIPTHHGRPQRMVAMGGSVYLQTTDARFQIMSYNIETDGYLETAGRFLRHAQLVLGFIPEGEGGTRDPNACQVTKWGDVVVDVEARNFYLFNGNSNQALGDFGMTKFFDKYMPYENTGVRDERAKDGVGYSIGVDNARNLIFITKTDGKRSWTLSFDMENQSWVGFEYFHPLVYAWDRFNMFSLDKGKMWRHNEPGIFSSVYGESVPMVVDFVITDKETLDSFKYHNSAVHAEFAEALIPKDDIFFTQIGFHNSFQSSGMLPVVHGNEQNMPESDEQDPSNVRVSNIHRSWRFDNMIDKVETKGQRLITSWKDDFFTEFTKVGETSNDEEVIDNYMVMRLVYDSKDTNVRVLLKHVVTQVNSEIL